MGNLMARFGETMFRLLGGVNPDTGLPNPASELQGALRDIVNPILIVLGGLGALFAIYLGVRLATAQDESKRKEAKAQLMWAIIGIILIFAMVGIFYLPFWGQIGGGAATMPY